MQRVSAFDVTVTLPLAIILRLLSVRGIGELSKMQTATEDYIQCRTLARQLQNGSDYLVWQMRMYTATGQREYMDNYFENLNVTRRRETALEYFGENYGDTEAFTLLKSAMMTSQNLSYTDRYAMRLVAQATLVDFSTWPQEIQSVSLHDSDMAMSDADKLRKAQQLVSNSQYQNTRDNVTERIFESLDSLMELTRNRQGSAETVFIDIYRKQELSAAILVILMIEICAMTRRLVVKPLNIYENGETPFAIIICDVDIFKHVNDTYGHAVGDQILKKVASLLQTTFRSIDYVCRIGGDEFAVIMVDVSQELDYTVRDKITTINNQLSCPTDDLPAVSLSVGVAFTERANPGESIFKDADKALYHVKQNGKHGCDFY